MLQNVLNAHIKLQEEVSKTRTSLIALICAAETLAALHARGYFFSDMKPENFLGINTNHWVIGDLESITKVGCFNLMRKSIYTSCHTSKEYLLFRTPGAEAPTTISTSAVDSWTLGTSILRVLNEHFFYYVFLSVNLKELKKAVAHIDEKLTSTYFSDQIIYIIKMLSDEKISKAITAVDVLEGMSASDKAALRGRMGERNFSQMLSHLARVKLDIGDLSLQALLLRMLQINTAMRISMEEAHAELKEITEGLALEH